MDETRFELLTRAFAGQADRRKAVLAAAGLLLGGAIARGGEAEARGRRSRRVAGQAGGNPTKTTICHYSKDEDRYLKITVDDKSLKAHKAHGDFRYGDCCNGDECSREATCNSGTCTCTHKDACLDQQTCGDGCRTIVPVEGGDCICHQGTACDIAQHCTATSECPKGWICAESCCEGARCLPPCGTQAGQEIEAGSGKFSTGEVL